MQPKLLNDAYAAMSDTPVGIDYDVRHGIASAGMLTVTDDEMAFALAEFLAPRVEGKLVVEIGGGIGLLGCHLGQFARRVYVIEANPLWASCYVAALYAHKPKNVSYLFGAAEEFAGLIEADVALFCTHSGVESMKQAARLFAPEVIDVHGEIIAGNPERFEALARTLREVV